MGMAAISTESKKSAVKEHARQRVTYLGEVIGGRLPLQREMLLWALLAETYLNFGFGDDVVNLVDRHVIDEKFAPPRLPADPEFRKTMLNFSCNLQGQQIMNWIVIPYLSGDITK